MADSIGDWLEELGLGKYSGAFVENEIDLATLPFVTDEAVEQIGVALAVRLKIMAAIAVRSAEDSTADHGSEHLAEPAIQRRYDQSLRRDNTNT